MPNNLRMLPIRRDSKKKYTTTKQLAAIIPFARAKKYTTTKPLVEIIPFTRAKKYLAIKQ